MYASKRLQWLFEDVINLLQIKIKKNPKINLNNLKSH